MEKIIKNGNQKRSMIQLFILMNLWLIMSIRLLNIKMVQLSRLMDQRGHTATGIAMVCSQKVKSGKMKRERIFLRSSSKSMLPQLWKQAMSRRNKDWHFWNIRDRMEWPIDKPRKRLRTSSKSTLLPFWRQVMRKKRKDWHFWNIRDRMEWPTDKPRKRLRTSSRSTPLPFWRKAMRKKRKDWPSWNTRERME